MRMPHLPITATTVRKFLTKVSSTAKILEDDLHQPKIVFISQDDNLEVHGLFQDTSGGMASFSYIQQSH